LPNDFPPWELVYQQTQRWLQAGCFESMVSDLRSVIRVAQGRRDQHSAVIVDGRTMQSTTRVVRVRAMTAISASVAASCISRWIRSDSC